MGKGNNNNNNYFSTNIQRLGEDFLRYQTPIDVKRSSNKIFRELARGKIEVAKYGKYFLNLPFINTLIDAATENYNFHFISYKGIETMMQVYPATKSDEVLGVCESHRRSSEAYAILCNILTMVKNTQDIGNLYVLGNQLYPYRYNL